MAGVAEPILVAAVRALPRHQRERLRHRVLALGAPIATGSCYVDVRGAACVAFLAALDDGDLEEISRTPLLPGAQIPPGAWDAYATMARGAGGLDVLVAVETEATEEDLVASIEEALG